MTRSLIIGMGEVGQALAKVFEAVVTLEHHVQTLDLEPQEITLPIDILHIAFPYSDKFTKQVQTYQQQFKPLVTVIYSTVPVGTSKQLGAMHSPIEGVHPDLADSIKQFTRFIGSDGSHYPVAGFWRDLGVTTQEVPSTVATEFMKLRSTSKYGINIVWTAYEAAVCQQLGIDFQLIKDFDMAYNELYRVNSPEGRTYQRYVLDPVEGPIGGHCVVPNAELLDKQYPSPLLKLIKEQT